MRVKQTASALSLGTNYVLGLYLGGAPNRQKNINPKDDDDEDEDDDDI